MSCEDALHNSHRTSTLAHCHRLFAEDIPAKTPTLLSKPIRNAAMMRARSLAVLAKTIRAIATNGRCAGGYIARRIRRRLHAIPIDVCVVFVVAQRCGARFASRCLGRHGSGCRRSLNALRGQLNRRRQDAVANFILWSAGKAVWKPFLLYLAETDAYFTFCREYPMQTAIEELWFVRYRGIVIPTCFRLPLRA
jgi:hypothetical protein